MSHTPGPWTTRESPEHWGRIDFVICSETTDVATAWQGGTKANRANACLIAAAPELLEALEALAEHVGYCSGDNECRPLENALAAIKKARGIK